MQYPNPSLSLPPRRGEKREGAMPNQRGLLCGGLQHFARSENFMALLLIHTEEELNFALQYTSKAAC